MVLEFIEYKHNSAHQYFNGQHYLYEVKLLQEMNDVNLTNNKHGSVLLVKDTNNGGGILFLQT